MGTSCEYGRIVIRRSIDGGRVWSEPAFLSAGPNYHTAPVPPAIYKGRVWRAFEYHPPGAWGFFEALVLSAPEKADLLDPGRGLRPRACISPRTPRKASTGWRATWSQALKGNYSTFCLWTRFEGMVEFPGGAKKFTIRYDRKSKLYWALTNPAPGEADPASVRNTLALISSPDLRRWQVRKVRAGKAIMY